MDVNNIKETQAGIQAQQSNIGLESAVKLSPLDLNNIRLDVRHTILTPDYLEGLKNSNN